MRASRLFVAILVLVAVVVLPAGIALAYPPANPVRTLPAEVERGATFDVIVNFTAPADNFTCIGLHDTAPDGWNVTAEEAWCTPRASIARADGAGNEASIMWYYAYDEGTNFTAKYKVTVPCGASLESHSFNTNFPIDIYLSYYIGFSDEICENITGDYVLQVIGPAICNKTSIDLYSGVGQNPQNETLELWSSTSCMINWTLTDDADYEGHDWLSENRTSGNCTDERSSVTVSANTSGMPLGDYTANITIESPEANNSPQIVPVNLHITLTGTLRGQVDLTTPLGAAPDARWVQSFVVKGFEPDTLTACWTRSATTDEYGVFTIPDLDAGKYDIGIKNCTCLSELEKGVVLTGGNPTEVTFDPIREGDCSENDIVDSGDRGLLYDGWNSPNIIQGGHLCDLDRDGAITGGDRGLLYDNWNSGGAAYGGF